MGSGSMRMRSRLWWRGDLRGWNKGWRDNLVHVWHAPCGSQLVDGRAKLLEPKNVADQRGVEKTVANLLVPITVYEEQAGGGAVGRAIPIARAGPENILQMIVIGLC